MSYQSVVGGDEEGGGLNVDCSIPSDVPEHLFQHVNQSLQNGIKEGMLMEILHQEPDKFWIITVTMVCGHLLRVRYAGSSEDFWCDLTKDTVHHFGWCGESKLTPTPPKKISTHIDELIPLLRSDIYDHVTVPEESLLDKGLSALDKIKCGMKVEIQNERYPYKYWIATVIENIGGRLLLRYDAPTNTVNDFWLFYTSPRLRCVGFCVSNGAPYQLQYPKSAIYDKFNSADWEACLDSSMKANKKIPFPKSIIMNTTISHHIFDEGMRLEAVNPANMREICPAYVSKVFDNDYFMVTVENGYHIKTNQWLCHSAFPYIFPVGWAQTNNINVSPPPQWKSNAVFNWKAYLESTASQAAPTQCFKSNKNAFNAGFRQNMKLEAADPENPSNICLAQILKIVKNLLLLKLEDTCKTYWFNCDSSDIFPIGWCSSHNIILQEAKTDNETSEIPKNSESFVSSKIQEEKCDRIYFNYKCYSGPFLSKNKLSQLPKHVGPGPLSLVIREVLNMIISVAYKPGRLLKDWEWEGKVQPNIKLDVLKAKLKTNTHHANVQVVSKSEQIPSFCKDMCSKLQACPYLFGPTEITDQCPERCLLVNNKTKFRMLSFKGKKRRRRGTHFMTVRARERRAALENENLSKDGAESGNESDQSLPSTPLHSESGTRPNSPDSNNSDPSNKKSRKKREARVNIPPMEMKTRGAKLPNFALQIKQGHWNRKDVETIYNNTCVVPRKQYSDDTESDNSNSCNSNETKINGDMEHISDVSDSEEPELKKLRVTPLHEPLRYDTKSIGYSDSSISLQSVNHCEMNLPLPPNPSVWTVDDLFKYLNRFDDCREMACKIKEEEIDGIAFIMLNLPTMREHLKLKTESALALCKHVTSLKMTYFSQCKC
ncbi:scm-like with four MBT domains protein 2 [Arctopsyche grandis]|uniref:scm-like with four MBT domains protein 2 n=1 Tax=Arctopsyche grandis TaxID=121162 RepID=UPI00406D90A1